MKNKQMYLQAFHQPFVQPPETALISSQTAASPLEQGS